MRSLRLASPCTATATCRSTFRASLTATHSGVSHQPPSPSLNHLKANLCLLDWQVNSSSEPCLGQSQLGGGLVRVARWQADLVCL